MAALGRLRGLQGPCSALLQQVTVEWQGDLLERVLLAHLAALFPLHAVLFAIGTSLVAMHPASNWRCKLGTASLELWRDQGGSKLLDCVLGGRLRLLLERQLLTRCLAKRVHKALRRSRDTL